MMSCLHAVLWLGGLLAVIAHHCIASHRVYAIDVTYSSSSGHSRTSSKKRNAFPIVARSLAPPRVFSYPLEARFHSPRRCLHGRDALCRSNRFLCAALPSLDPCRSTGIISHYIPFFLFGLLGSNDDERERERLMKPFNARYTQKHSSVSALVVFHSFCELREPTSSECCSFASQTIPCRRAHAVDEALLNSLETKFDSISSFNCKRFPLLASSAELSILRRTQTPVLYKLSAPAVSLYTNARLD